jgi:membrane protease YdiL (CAAX protease family)
LSILWAEFHEEFRLRGYMQNFIGKNYNGVIALIGISIYFALSHTFSHPEYNILMLLYLLIPAFIFGLEFLVYRNIVVTMTSHFLSNVSQMWIFAICYYFGKGVGLITALIAIGIADFLMTKNRKVFIEFIKESKKHLKTEPKNYLYGVLLGIVLLVYAYLLVKIKFVASLLHK